MVWTRPLGARGFIGHTCGVRVQRVQKVQRERFLGLTGLTAGGFLSLTAFQAEGCGLPLCGNAYKISVTGFTFSVIWHEKHSAELSAFGRYTPYPAVPDFPRKRGQNKSLYAFLQRHGSMAKHP